MAILNSNALSILVSYIKSYVNNQISSNFTTGTAAKATADASGNVITTTYATKTYTDNAVSSVTGSANFIKSASVSGNTLTLTKGNNSTVTFTKPGSPSDLTMVNYIKPSSTSAISTSDTLTQAIGKLEKALDEKVDSDDESVATFDSNDKLVFPDGTKIWIS